MSEPEKKKSNIKTHGNGSNKEKLVECRHLSADKQDTGRKILRKRSKVPEPSRTSLAEGKASRTSGAGGKTTYKKASDGTAGLESSRVSRVVEN